MRREWHVGGLVGANYGGTVTRAMRRGPVSGNTDVGGLVGHNAGGVNASYLDTTTSGRTTGSAGAGQSTSALHGPTGYAGLYAAWDVDDDGTADSPWSFGTSGEYPVLSADVDGDGTATWEEFGWQLCSGPVVTATAGTGAVALTWTAVDASAWTPARAVHLTERRGALGAAYAAAGRSAPVYTDAGVTAGVTPMRAV